MLSVAEARARLLAALEPLPAETVTLPQARGRVLAAPVTAAMTQPPQAVSAMDGYALKASDAGAAGARLRVVGEVPAGRPLDRAIGAGEAARIFTGGALPDGTDAILIQENATRDGDTLVVEEPVEAGRFVRPAGLDFKAGDSLLLAGTRLGARALGLAAAMDRPWLKVVRRPRVALLSTGDELSLPGEARRPGGIVGSNGTALSALVEGAGGEAIDLGLVGDSHDELAQAIAAARGADLLVTSGGASVGAHDVVAQIAQGQGASEGDGALALDFWRIAMRPGKPLLFGKLGDLPLLGLPGNPVSALVCGLLFLVPMLERFQGLSDRGEDLTPARLRSPLGANDKRQDYLRARAYQGADVVTEVEAFTRQDSSMQATLNQADCLIMRPPLAEPAPAGSLVPCLFFARRVPFY